MTRWARRLAWAPLALLLLTACPAGGGSAGPGTRRAVAAWAQAAPAAVLTGAVDLSAASGGVPASATAAVAEPDGGADVVVTPDDSGLPVRLVTLDAALRPIAAVAVPELDRLWDLYGLPDGSVLLAGELRAGLGFALLDPRTGAHRDVVVRPPADGPMSGGSLLSPDGRTVYLLLDDELVAVDVASGAVVAHRDLTDDVGAVSGWQLPAYATWLVAAPAGVGLVFDAWPDETDAAVPAVLAFGPDLVPVPSAGVLNGPSGSVAAVATAAGGTLFLMVSGADGAHVLALPAGEEEATTLVRLDPSVLGYALAVDPWQGWAMTPAPGGVQAVNLVTGGSRRVDVGCALDGTVRALAPGRRPTSVLAAGRCDAPATGTPMLWAVEL